MLLSEVLYEKAPLKTTENSGENACCGLHYEKDYKVTLLKIEPYKDPFSKFFWYFWKNYFKRTHKELFILC